MKTKAVDHADFWKIDADIDSQWTIRESLKKILQELNKIQHESVNVHASILEEIGNWAEDAEAEVIDRLKECCDACREWYDEIEELKKAEKAQQEKNK